MRIADADAEGDRAPTAVQRGCLAPDTRIMPPERIGDAGVTVGIIREQFPGQRGGCQVGKRGVRAGVRSDFV